MISGNVSLTVHVHGHESVPTPTDIVDVASTGAARGLPRAAWEYVSPVDRNLYIEGRRGSNFSILVENRGSSRILAIPSVDGLSVMDGKPAGSQSGGFILEARSSIVVPGWMFDGATAARFFFAGDAGAGDRSYVNQIGADAANRGVIGLIVIEEKELPRRPFPDHGFAMASRGMLRAAPPSSTLSASASASAQSLGAGFGEATEFRTRAGAFRRGRVREPMALYYDDERGLKRRGIDARRPAPVGPNPFPADGPGCPIPPGWTR
jgi:hypothetical protein